MTVFKIPNFARNIALFYLFFLALFACFRFALLLFEVCFSEIIIKTHAIEAFRKGIMFDLLICGYLLILPFFLFLFSDIFPSQKIKLYSISKYIIGLGLTLSLIISVSNITYFDYFQSHITEAILNWLGSPKSVLSLIISEPKYLFSLVLFFGLTFILIKITNKIFNHIQSQSNPQLNIKSIIFWGLLMATVIFSTLRGRIDAPLREGDAYFTTDPFYNQLGLNPIFTFIKSFTNKVNLMDVTDALKYCKIKLKADPMLEQISPIARYQGQGNWEKKPNIIFVIMESMTAAKMGRFGCKFGLTPNLDSIAQNGISFNKIFSAGIHTNNGVFSTLYSFPALKRIRPMATVPINDYHGIPHVCKVQGYQTLFFTTHDPGFDNLGVFTLKNGYQEIFSSESYPKDKIVGTYGVPDDYMFEYAIAKLNQKSSRRSPFFATLLTTSDHPPYILPKNIPFTPKNKALNLAMVEYADWSIGKFMNLASKQDWFKNTVFVFVADHGAVFGKNHYDLVLSYHHIPFIVYAPKIFAPQSIDKLGGQIDVFPTVMGLLGNKFLNLTMGLDLTQNKRECIYFSADNKIACIDQDWLFVARDGGNESLYKHSNNDLHDYIAENKNKADSLKKEAFASIQATEWLILNQKTSIAKNSLK